VRSERLRTFDGVEEALKSTAKFYRKDLWASADCYVEVWLEKDALAGVVMPVTSAYDVPLMVARGYASLSFLHTAAEYIGSLDVPTYIYHLGDFDPSGVNAGEKIEERLRRDGDPLEVDFGLRGQFAQRRLPTGTYRPDRPKSRTPARRGSAKSQSSWMPLIPIGCAR
jgi:hypothetical protein